MYFEPEIWLGPFSPTSALQDPESYQVIQLASCQPGWCRPTDQFPEVFGREGQDSIPDSDRKNGLELFVEDPIEASEAEESDQANLDQILESNCKKLY